MIINVGSGSTTLIDALVELGYTQIIASDISDIALDSIKERLGSNNSVEYISDDLTASVNIKNIEEVDLWIDRAVLHFFNDER